MAFDSQSANTEKTAKTIMNVAADELSPLRRDPQFWGRDRVEMPKMTTSIDDEMARLNRNPAEMRAVIKAMEAHPKDGLNVKIEKDAQGNPKTMTFEIPQTAHTMSQAHRVDLLSERENKTVQKLADNFANLPNSMTFNQLRAVANTMKFLEQDPKLADRIQTNLNFELHARNPKTMGIGNAYKDGNFDALMAYRHMGNHPVDYFHVNGAIDNKAH